MVEYRSFRNFDPPALLQLWHEAGLGRGAAQGFTCDVFDLLIFGQYFFDPEGLQVAVADRRVVGFVHAGFGPDPFEKSLERSAGVICLAIVHPDYRRRGIGTELVRRAEAYLTQAGAQVLQAGPAHPMDPFYVGLYGGSNTAGFLKSDPLADPFFRKLGYRPCERRLIWQRDISQKTEPVDVRVITARRTMQLGVTDQPVRLSRWWIARWGQFETLRFILMPKKGGTSVAEVVCCGLDLYMRNWQQRAVGLSSLLVSPSERHKGYAKLLLLDVFRRLREESFTLAEIQVPDSSAAGNALVRSLGFHLVDEGFVYRKGDEGDGSLESGTRSTWVDTSEMVAGINDETLTDFVPPPLDE